MGRVRDYGEITRRLRQLPSAEWQVTQAGKVWDYPFFLVRRYVARQLPTILVTAGLHGEEPGGVEGALRWLENGHGAKWHVNWVVLPCINPYGWERNQRRNPQRRDINRQFRNSTDCPEAELVKRLVDRQRFLFTFDLHEDVDTPGYYLYELRNEPPYIGERVVKAVSQVLPINRDRMIDGNEATGPGLIRRDGHIDRLNRRARWPMAYHLFLNCTSHSIFGSETPVHVPLERRAEAHTVALRTVLQALI